MTASEITIPWYKQFWPWFIIALPASVVVASIITVAIALDKPDSLVADNYYKEGLTINRKLGQDETARQLALHATLSIDPLVGEVQLVLSGLTSQWPETLNTQWFHPTAKEKDFSILLKRSSGNRYIGQLQQALSQRWYLQVSGEQPEPWRLKTEIVIKAPSSSQKAPSSSQKAPSSSQKALSDSQKTPSSSPGTYNLSPDKALADKGDT